MLFLPEQNFSQDLKLKQTKRLMINDYQRLILSHRLTEAIKLLMKITMCNYATANYGDPDPHYGRSPESGSECFFLKYW